MLADHLVADHPETLLYHSGNVPTAKITMIPYGADEVLGAPESVVRQRGLVPGSYVLVVANSVPDNSILEIVSAFSRRQRGVKLLLVGRYEPQKVAYHRAVLDAASSEVLFPGPIYRPDIASIRFHAALYIHGHTVGGTNPSLVESLAAGNPVLAMDNVYNRWVAGSRAARYFTGVDDCDALITTLLHETVTRHEMSAAARARYRERFTQQAVLGEYENLLVSMAQGAGKRQRRRIDVDETVAVAREGSI
jgi:glycosyltransferase involved in cell wall biosynthesis